MGRIDDAAVAEHRRVVGGYDLPMRIPDGSDAAELVRLMGRDKKSLGDGLTFVLDGPSGVEVVRDVPPSLVESTLEALR